MLAHSGRINFNLSAFRLVESMTECSDQTIMHVDVYIQTGDALFSKTEIYFFYYHGTEFNYRTNNSGLDLTKACNSPM